MTGTPDEVPPLTPITMPGVQRSSYRAYPLVDHIADKTCAIIERHGAGRQPSTRYKDLVDLVALVTSIGVPATDQRRALLTESDRRSLPLPERFAVPDRGLWEPGYGAEARRAKSLDARTLDQALAVVCPFLDPLLNDSAIGSWRPHEQTWAG